MRTVATILVLLSLSPANYLDATTRKVPQDFAKIQLAINAAIAGDTVLVAEGTYAENLVMTDKIILGSLFLIDNDTSHISKTIIHGGTPSHVDSGSVILLLIGTDTSTVIKGFTIQNGRGTKYPGAKFLHGGGIAIQGGGATISDNIIKNNKCTSSTYSTGAAGIDIESDPYDNGPAPWAITNNTIVNNISTSSTPSSIGGAQGGGLGLTGSGIVLNNTIANNKANGSYIGYGGGVDVWSWVNGTDIVFNNNVVMSNSSTQYGGGLCMAVNTDASKNPYPLNVSFANNIIVGNSTPISGGAIFVNSGNYTWINNTVANNSGWEAINLNVDRGALVFELLNNIIWNPGTTVEINSMDYATARYNCIRDGYPGAGNFSANPNFISDGSYALSGTSYCIGRGIDSVQFEGVWYASPKKDIKGTTRPTPSGSSLDVGAVEHSSGSPIPLPWQPIHLQFSMGGISRSCIIEIPLNFVSVKNLPVVFSLNGYGGDAFTQHNYIRTHLLGDSVGYITVYPEAYQKRWNSGISANTSWSTPNVNDVAFISAIIDSLIMRYSIDTTRVYSCGFSNGGFMSLRLAAQLSNRIAAVASVGGVMTTISAAAYSATRPIPAMLMHGTADVVVPYNGGVTNWYSLPQTIDFWKQKNSCTLPAETLYVPNRVLTDNSTVEVYTYKSPSNSSQVKLYKIIGGGHEWPGAPSYPGATVINRDIDANVEIWNFFKRFTTMDKSIGEILCLATNGSTLFAGATEGVYRSSNSGGSWSFAGVPSRSIFALAVGPDDAGGIAVFAASVDTVFRSTDNGDTWSPATAGLNVFRGNQFVSGSWIESLMFGSTENGATDLFVLAVGSEVPDLFRSTNQGTSWTSIRSGLPSAQIRNGLYSAIVIDPNVFVWDYHTSISSGESYVSTDRGDTWTPSNLTALYGIRRPAVLSGVAHPATFFHNGKGLNRVTFSGTDCKSTPAGFNDRMVGAIAAHVTGKGDTVIAVDVYTIGGSAHSVFISTNNGSAWKEVPGSGDFVPNLTGTYALTFSNDGANLFVGAKNGIFKISGVTSVEKGERQVPVEFSLSQNYPNPFNPSTTIRYTLPSSAHVKLVVYDLLGREVATLVNEEQSAGRKEVQWNASNFASGMYFYKITAGNFVSTKRTLLIK